MPASASATRRCRPPSEWASQQCGLRLHCRGQVVHPFGGEGSHSVRDWHRDDPFAPTLCVGSPIHHRATNDERQEEWANQDEDRADEGVMRSKIDAVRRGQYEPCGHLHSVLGQASSLVRRCAHRSPSRCPPPVRTACGLCRRGWSPPSSRGATEWVNSPTDSRLAWDVSHRHLKHGSSRCPLQLRAGHGLATMHLTGLVPYRQAWPPAT